MKSRLHTVSFVWIGVHSWLNQRFLKYLMPGSTSKIVVISAGVLAPGGVETHVRLLASALRKAGATVYICGTGYHWGLKSQEDLTKAGVKFLLPPRAVASRSRIGALLCAAFRWRIQLPSHISCLYAIGAGKSHSLLKRLLGGNPSSVYHEIVYPPGRNSPAADSLRRMDAAVANSRFAAEEMERICPGKPLRVIPFLTAESPVPPPVPRPFVGKRPLQVGYLGRLEERKRAHILVREWERLTSAGLLSAATLHLHGDDSGSGLRQEMERQARSSAIASHVRFHGSYRHDEVAEIFSHLDFVVLPSEWEGLPLVLVEAMQHGVPFVATSAGGTAELGLDNPDVVITGLGWDDFERGLLNLATRLKSNQVDSHRLHAWVESRYGYEAVAPRWCQALLESPSFFARNTEH